MVVNCSICVKDCFELKELFMLSFFFLCLWERLVVDFFEFEGKVYLIVVDYYLRWFEIKRLND